MPITENGNISSGMSEIHVDLSVRFVHYLRAEPYARKRDDHIDNKLHRAEAGFPVRQLLNEAADFLKRSIPLLIALAFRLAYAGKKRAAAVRSGVTNHFRRRTMNPNAYIVSSWIRYAEGGHFK